MKKIMYWSLLCFIIIPSLFFTFQIGKAKNDLVYVVPVEREVEKGLFAFLKRAIETAEKDGAKVIIFDINTPGGVVDAAGEIGQLIANTDVKTVAFVNPKALSAGAFISLHADEIYMVPNGTMGSAAIIDQSGNTADKKAVSYWLAAMEGAAERSGRDPIYALAMADESIELPELGVEKGELLTLTADQALKVGYSEGTVQHFDDLLRELGLEKATVQTVEESFAEKLARFITHPIIVPILLTIGSLGLVLELYSPGFGVPGFMGLTSLLLFFYGHVVAGLAGYEVLILFIIGVGLIIAEFFLPGGVAGTLGLISILVSILLSGGSIIQMGISLLIAIVLSIVTMVVMVKVFGRKIRFFSKIILKDSTNTELGYVSNVNRIDLLGKVGLTLTPLRPAGTIVVNDERLDVVTEGGYIGAQQQVKIVKVEGSRVVVRRVEEQEQKNG
jgi:membrane-bound serine protease (ClpP class)